MRRRVLLVAAESDLRARFARELQSSGYAVELACDMKRALRLAAENHFWMAIAAPGLDHTSLAMITMLRDTVSEMVVVVEGPDEIACLRSSLPGIDQFILKSAKDGALSARVSEIIALADSAAGEGASAPSTAYIGDCKLKLDLGGHVLVTLNGQEVTLTRAESSLLRELVRNPCQVVSRDKLRYAVAGRPVDPSDCSIDMLVARVRRKIEPDPKVPRFLLTVPGAGYKLMARTRPAEQSGAEPPETTELLSRLPAHLVADLFAGATPLKVAADRVLFLADDPGDSCYRVEDGLLKVTMVSRSGIERILSFLGPGGIVGELAILDGLPRSASVVAVRDTVLRRLSRAEFDAFAEKHPELYKSLITLLTQRLRETNVVVAAESFLSLRGRVALTP
jgi:DNA-binding response OmpR family regulator/CRP-like cAMP-binding protein